MDRTKYLGGTDIAAIEGFHPYKSAVQVYAEKVGLSAGPTDNEPMWWGRALEAPIADWYAEAQDPPVTLTEPGLTLHKDYPQIGGRPDRMIQKARGVPPHAVLEVKCVGPWGAHRWGDSYTDEVPDEYLCQVAWYMMLTDQPYCDIAAGFAMKKREIYRVERNQKLEDHLLESGLKFWHDHVEAMVPPQVLENAPKSHNEALKAIFPTEERPMIPATMLMTKYAEEMQVLDVRMKADKTRKETLVAMSKRECGDAEGMEGAFGKIHWKTSRGSINYKKCFEQVCAKMLIGQDQQTQTVEDNRYPSTRRFRSYWSK